MTFRCLLKLLLLLPCIHTWPQHHSCTSRFDDDGLEILNCSDAKFQKISTQAQYAAPRNIWMPSLFTAQIKELHLRGNQLEVLNGSSFLTLRYPETLEKLDLANNRIVSIASNAFQGLRNLKYLDLSGNRLYTLNRTTFNGLDNLETLILDDNFFSAFPEKTFSSLQHLRIISVRSNQFACDCQLTDFFKSLHRDNRLPIRISNNTKCVFPVALRGVRVSDLNAKAVKRACGKGDFNPEVFAIEPSSARSLIVYPGDERKLTCKISNIANMTMEWLRDGAPIKETDYNGRLKVQMRSDPNLKTITLTFKSVAWTDSGYWTCYVEHKESNLRMTVRLMPISANTEKCVQEWTADEKGEIVWAEAKHTKTVVAPCPNGPEGSHARRHCNQGLWSPVDSAECDFASSTTKQLYEIHARGNRKTFMQDLLNVTAGTNRIDPTVFLTAYETRLASWLIGNATDTAGLLTTTAVAMLLRSPFAKSEANGNVLRRMIQNSIINEMPFESEQMAACQHMVLPQSIDQFSSSNEPSEAKTLGFLAARIGKRFLCVKQTSVDLLSPNRMTSIRIPSQTIESLPPVTVLRAYWFANQRLFHSSHSEFGHWVAHGEVQALALKKVNLKLHRVDQPKNIQSSVQSDQPTPLQPAIYFSFPIKYSTANARFGIWSEKNGWSPVDETLCFTSIVGPESILVSCSSSFLSKLSENLTYLSIMENATISQMMQTHKTAIQLPWWTYVSSGFLASSVFIVILINICYIRKTQCISRKMFHAMLNICLSIFALCVVFTIGVDKVYSKHICRVSSVVLHYLILSVVFWILVAIRQVHRKMTTVRTQPSTQMSESQKIAAHGAMAGLYFFAYGVPLIVVSFSVAIDPGTYGGTLQYCFPSPSVHSSTFEAGVVAPYLLISSISVLLFLLTWCQTRKGHLESVPSIPMPDRRTPQNSLITTRGDESSLPLVVPVSDDESCSIASSYLDLQNSASFQLTCLISLLLIYTASVVTAAAFVSNQFANFSLTMPPAMSIVHSICVVFLALCLFLVHVVKRFRMLWTKLTKSENRRTEKSATTEAHASVYSKPFPCAQTNTFTRSLPLPPEDATLEYDDQQYGSYMFRSMHSDGSPSQVALSPAVMESMHNTAKKFYKRQRQMAAAINSSAQSGDVQDSVIYEESEDYEVANDNSKHSKAVETQEYYNIEIEHNDKKGGHLPSSGH